MFTPCNVYVWLESRAEIINVSYSWILPLRQTVTPLQQNARPLSSHHCTKPQAEPMWLSKSKSEARLLPVGHWNSYGRSPRRHSSRPWAGRSTDIHMECSAVTPCDSRRLLSLLVIRAIYRHCKWKEG